MAAAQRWAVGRVFVGGRALGMVENIEYAPGPVPLPVDGRWVVYRPSFCSVEVEVLVSRPYEQVLADLLPTRRNVRVARVQRTRAVGMHDRWRCPPAVHFEARRPTFDGRTRGQRKGRAP